jgi:hypothetical protein
VAEIKSEWMAGDRESKTFSGPSTNLTLPRHQAGHSIIGAGTSANGCSPMKGNTIIVLGAGASRGVSYQAEIGFPSFLDRDFFDLLQRLDPKQQDRESVDKVCQWARDLSSEYWRSMERSFYTLHLQSYIAEKIAGTKERVSDSEIVTCFVNSIGALLRQAHGTKTCKWHRELFEHLCIEDAIITFNYDLVPERALKEIDRVSRAKFGPWLYGFAAHPRDWQSPVLLKLHGSFNWNLPKENEDVFTVRTKNWSRFKEVPGFPRFKNPGTKFPIFLPFWDKRIEEEPWRRLWGRAYQILKTAETLIVWGYSLPATDIKARQLFELALRDRQVNLCVIDRSTATRDRWRMLLPDARYWEFTGIQQFFRQPPEWWAHEPLDRGKKGMPGSESLSRSNKMGSG